MYNVYVIYLICIYIWMIYTGNISQQGDRDMSDNGYAGMPHNGHFDRFTSGFRGTMGDSCLTHCDEMKEKRQCEELLQQLLEQRGCVQLGISTKTRSRESISKIA